MSLKDYINNKPTLETNRLILRTLTKEDVPALCEWMSDKTIYKYWGMNPGKNDKNPMLLFERKEKPTKSFHWGIINRSNKKAIGEIWIYLIQNDRMAKAAFRLSPEYQGKGLALEALEKVIQFCFTKTELQKIWTDVHIENHPSYKTLEKAGFVREGCIRSGKMVNIYCDYYLYGLLKVDYCK
ncbi:MAG: GNAT family protein [Eubacteriales bacterium]|nr:GNAT family protein [Eubacteriales bacterium]